MALPNVPHQTGRVNSGDVSIFYRRFGARGQTPMLIMHGASYYDSYDWIGVAGALASDREVIAFDRRGWGESSWSPSKDYSIDAHVDDALAVASAMRWDKVIVMGHSASGRVVVSLAANFPDKVAALIIVDPLMAIPTAGGAAGGGRRPTTGNPPLVFPSIEAAMANFAKLNNPPRFGLDRERAQHALVRLDEGFMLKRDPDNGNSTPIGEGAQMPRRPRSDVWKDLAAVKSPTMLVRGLRSDRWDDPAILARLTKDYTKVKIETVEAQHDVPNQAPDALVAHVRKFTATI
jgi:pimeloyl-ACP methyl ester carboxylesterase